MTMKQLNYLAIALVLFVAACKQEKQPEVVAEKVWSKTMISSVDIEKTYFEDPNDEDFSEFSALFREVVQGVYDGDLQAYEYWSGTPISADSAKRMMNRVDTVYVENPETQLLEKKAMESSIEDNIPSIKIKEKWYLDKANWKIEKNVLAIAPRMPVFGTEGELRGYSPLFWVFLDEEAEKEFIKAKKEQLGS